MRPGADYCNDDRIKPLSLCVALRWAALDYANALVMAQVKHRQRMALHDRNDNGAADLAAAVQRDCERALEQAVENMVHAVKDTR